MHVKMLLFLEFSVWAFWAGDCCRFSFFDWFVHVAFEVHIADLMLPESYVLFTNSAGRHSSSSLSCQFDSSSSSGSISVGA